MTRGAPLKDGNRQLQTFSIFAGSDLDRVGLGAEVSSGEAWQEIFRGSAANLYR